MGEKETYFQTIDTDASCLDSAPRKRPRHTRGRLAAHGAAMPQRLHLIPLTSWTLRHGRNGHVHPEPQAAACFTIGD